MFDWSCVDVSLVFLCVVVCVLRRPPARNAINPPAISRAATITAAMVK